MKPFTYLVSRTSPKNHLRASYAEHFRKIGSFSSVYGGRISNLSITLMRPRMVLPVLASKREAKLNYNISNAFMVAAAAITVIVAVANRVLYKLTLIPMSLSF